MESRHCRAVLSAGHLTSSCCRLALLTNRAARCCWWDGKKLWAFWKAIMGYQAGGWCAHSATQMLRRCMFLSFICTCFQQKIFTDVWAVSVWAVWRYASYRLSLSFYWCLVCLYLYADVHPCLPASVSHSLQSISPTAKLILRWLPLLAMQSFI